METAGLRIKFKPLIHKKTKSNSKCFLEIVPEVSSIQNLDKFIWKRKSNLIIYTIPMTHKVVLQKLEAVRDDSDTTVKTYHSCVDLLLTTSNSMLGCLGSGDVTKIISDTLVLKKCLNNCTSEENSIQGRRKHSDYESIVPICQGTTQTLLQLENLEEKHTRTNIMNYKGQPKTKKRKRFLNVERYGELLDKMTNTENVYPIFGDTVQNENVVMKTGTKSFVKRESARLLSLSPICSVNTHETPFINRIVSCKSVTCKMHESQKDLVLLGSISSPSDLSRDNQALSTIIDVTRQKSPKKLRVMCANSPEMKVIEYVRYIENEILPLKMWLNDIKRKCTALGMEFSKQPSKEFSKQPSIEFSKQPSIEFSIKTSKESSKQTSKEFSKQTSKEFSKQTSKEFSKQPSKEFSKEPSQQCRTINRVSTSNSQKMSIAAEITKSNRAVYKIVFDG